MQSLDQQINDVQSRIAGRQAALDAAGIIPLQRQLIEGIVGGRIRPPDAPGQPPTIGGQTARAREFLREAKATLYRLIDLAAGRDAAIAANERDRAELVKLHEKRVAAAESYRRKTFEPENMKWVSDE
jgi:hypothetical protein